MSGGPRPGRTAAVGNGVKIRYEWDVESFDEKGEMEHMFCSSLKEAIRLAGDGRVVLVYSTGSDSDGVVDRAWAYLDANGELPEFFAVPSSAGNYRSIKKRVPLKFHHECRRLLYA